MTLKKQTGAVERITRHVFRKFNVNENSHINKEDYPEITEIITTLSKEEQVSSSHVLKILQIC